MFENATEMLFNSNRYIRRKKCHFQNIVQGLSYFLFMVFLFSPYCLCGSLIHFS
jgi:hypothetical protein